jgi:hypothetical protein
MCGGPTQEQKDAAKANADLANTELGQYKAGTAVTTPFYSSQVTNPEQDPALATQYGIQKAQMKARNAGYGSALPSGFEAQQEADLGEQYGRAQDENMYARRMAGAAGLNPQASAGVASGTNSGIFNSTALQNNFWGNLINGVIRGGAQVGSAALAA